MTQALPDRYHRQQLLPQVGTVGQARLAAARVLVVGCGALGAGIAEQIVRAGVGHVILADRDWVELTNLQRQALFDESDAAAGVPKAIAAATHLRRINSTVTVDPRVIDVESGNILELMAGADLVFDGTDNVETRYLINDAAIRAGVPWVYGGCVGVEGRVMGISPGHTPCLRCIWPDPPTPGSLPTCDTAGVLGPAAGAVAAIQAGVGLRLLIEPDGFHPALLALELWDMRTRRIDLADSRRDDCPACGQRRFDFLDRPRSASTTTLCGRDAVQIRPRDSSPARIDLADLARRLAPAGRVESNPYLVRCALLDSPLRLTVFPDARAIIQGTTDPAKARSIYARWIGA